MKAHRKSAARLAQRNSCYVRIDWSYFRV